MKIIPLIINPNQTLKIVLDEQDLTIHVYQRNENLYMDLTLCDEVIFTGQICVHGHNIITFAQNKFKGSLHFLDVVGETAPNWESLGTRYFLVFYSENEKIPEVIKW